MPFQRSPSSIHFFIIVAVAAVHNRCNPVRVLKIPVNRPRNALFKFYRWLPAEFPVYFRSVYCISAVMPGAIFDKTDQGTAGLPVNQPSDPFIKYVTDRLYDLDILFFSVAAN